MSLILRSFIPKNLTQLIRSSFYNLQFGIKNVRKFSETGPEFSLHDKREGCSEASSRGLVVGIYADPDDLSDPGVLTPTGIFYDKHFTRGRLHDLITISGAMPKIGEARLFFDIETVPTKSFSAVAVVGLGKECLGYNSYEMMDESKEAIRKASAAGVMALQALKTTKIVVESFGDAESAAEGAALGIWCYQELKQKKQRKLIPNIHLYNAKGLEYDVEGWKIGIQKAAAQNLVRQLQETPANLLTPTSFAQTAVEILCKSGVNVEVKVSGWAESQQMNSFLAVSRASCETPIFLELSYYGAKPDERPIVLIGQGVTFDSGGLNLREYDQLKHMRGSMTGAAIVIACCRAIAALRLPINIRGLIPLCENVIGCNAFKPGDIYKTMSGKCIEVQRTNCEDALILIDALTYAQNFSPKFIIDIGNASYDMTKVLDDAATAIFTNSEVLWQQIKNASIHTGCRVWRFPIWGYFTKQICSSSNVDVQNLGLGWGGVPCKMAAFLHEFVPCGQWMHIETTNVMTTNGVDFNYLREGMAGRPARTIVEFLAQTVCFDNQPKVVG